MMKSKWCNTFTCTIYCGLREGYDGKEHSIDEVESLLQYFVDNEGCCVTIKPTKFIYTNGNENGVEIGLIQYPRFLKSTDEIFDTAKEIALMLMKEFKQHRVSIVSDDLTLMLDSEDYE